MELKNPELVVVIEITNDLLCMAVLEEYFERKCYNLISLAKSDQELNDERERLIKKQKESEARKINPEIKCETDKAGEIIDGADKETEHKPEIQQNEVDEDKEDIDII